MLSEVAMEIVESSYLPSSVEQYPGNVYKHVEKQRFFGYILIVS